MVALPEGTGLQTDDALLVTFNVQYIMTGEGREKGRRGKGNTGSGFNKEHSA